MESFLVGACFRATHTGPGESGFPTLFRRSPIQGRFPTCGPLLRPYFPAAIKKNFEDPDNRNTLKD